MPTALFLPDGGRFAREIFIPPRRVSEQFRQRRYVAIFRDETALERERNSRISLTYDGHTFLADAKQTLAHAETAVRNARASTGGSTGQLQIANTPRLSNVALPPLLERFGGRSRGSTSR